jgi:hypothetical protein
MTINDVFGANFYQDADVIRFAKADLGVSLLGANSAESILCAIALKALDVGVGNITALSIATLTGNGLPISTRDVPISYPSLKLTGNGGTITANGSTIDISPGGTITANGLPLLERAAANLTATAPLTLTANGQPLTFKSPEGSDLLAWMGNPSLIWQRGRLERIDRLTVYTYDLFT